MHLSHTVLVLSTAALLAACSGQESSAPESTGSDSAATQSTGGSSVALASHTLDLEGMT